MNKYAVKVKQSPGWRDAKSCIVSISQGQECHEGAKLDALLEWGLSNHERCILNVSDTLHRHNLPITGEDAQRKAYSLGNEWLQRNEATVSKYRSRFYRIHRWNDWLHHPDFAAAHENVLSFYATNAAFRDAAEKDIDLFMERKAPENSAEYEKMRNGSTAYLLEEIAAYIIMSRTYRASRVYPAATLSSFAWLRENKDAVPPVLHGMEMSLDVRVLLKRRKDLALLQEAA